MMNTMRLISFETKAEAAAALTMLGDDEGPFGLIYHAEAEDHEKTEGPEAENESPEYESGEAQVSKSQSDYGSRYMPPTDEGE